MTCCSTVASSRVLRAAHDILIGRIGSSACLFELTPRMDHTSPRLLFVCSGNICRSPLAEVMARAALNAEGIDAVVQSCGTSALTGQRAEAGARSAAADLGLLLDEHRAQP